MITTLIILGIIFLSASIVLTFRPWLPPALFAYAGMWLLKWAGIAVFDTYAMIFWGCATLLVLMLDAMLPRQISRGGAGRGYIGGGALAGMVVGMILSSAGIVLGGVLGAFLGGMAYSRTPIGRRLRFPSEAFMRFVCAVGLPSVVAMSMVGMVLWQLLKDYSPMIAGF